MYCTWALFLSLGDMKGRDVLSNVIFLFYRWRWCWFRSEEKTGSSHPHSSSVPTSSAEHGSPATDFGQHLITLIDQLCSVLRSNPIRQKGVFGGKSKLGMLTDWLICIVYVCRSFIFVFSKLTKKQTLDITASLCMVIRDYMTICIQDKRKCRRAFCRNGFWNNTRQRIFFLTLFSIHAMGSLISSTS